MTNSLKFQGLITDRMGTIQSRKTRFYTTYKEAHDAAEKLAKKYFTADRYEISIH